MTWHTTSALADHLGVSPNAIRSAYSKGHKVKGHHVERRLEGRKAFFRLVDTHPAAKWFEDKAPGGTVKGYDTQEELHEALAAEGGETIHQRGDYTIVEESLQPVPFDIYMKAIKSHNKTIQDFQNFKEVAQLAIDDLNKFKLACELAQAKSSNLSEERDELIEELQSCREALEIEQNSSRTLLRDLRAAQDELRAMQNQGGFKSVVRELRNRARGLK